MPSVYRKLGEVPPIRCDSAATIQTLPASHLQKTRLSVSTEVAELTTVEMNSVQKQLKHRARSKSVVAGLMLGLFLFVLAMANFETLHCDVHADAETADHQCVVTLLASGQIDTASCAISVSEISFPVLHVAAPKVLDLVSVDYSLLPGRGPPASLDLTGL